MSARAWLPRRFARALLPATVALLIGASLGGIADAVWSAPGNGNGTGATATALAVVVSPGTPTAMLYPGGQASVALTVSNANAFSVRIGSLSLDTTRGTAGFSVDAGHSGCAVSVLTLATQTNGGAGWTLPARVGAVNGSLPITLPNALGMSVNAADACQGAAFTVALVAGV